jgi:hypothetical protein
MIIDVGMQELRVLAILMLVWIVGASSGQTTQSLLALVFLQLALGIISDASVTALIIIILAVALIREMLRLGRGGSK